MNPFTKEYKTDEDDKQLIKKSLSGDKSALENLLKKHQPYIYNIAWKMVQMTQPEFVDSQVYFDALVLKYLS